MALGNITSANSTAVMTVDTLFPASIVLQQYSTDAGVTLDSETLTESRMGIDGNLASGFVPNLKPVTIKLEATSPTLEAFTTLREAMVANRTVYECTLVISLPAVGKTATLTGGVLQQAQAMPNIEKTLSPTTWQFVFERMTVA